MKYIKVLFIFLISFITTISCAEKEVPGESSIESESAKTSTTTDSNNLKEWYTHLESLDENWNALTNVPLETWTNKAIDIATDIVTANVGLADTFKKEFFDAIRQKTTDLTPDIVSVINKFDTAIKEAETQLSPEITQETTEESTAEESTEEVAPLQQESAQEPTEVKQDSESISSIEKKTTASSSAEETAATTTAQQSEENELTAQDWQNCIRDIKNKQRNLSDALAHANEVATKLKDSGTITSKTLIKDFADALDLCMAQKRLNEADKSTAMNDFMAALGIYNPAQYMPMPSYYQPTESFMEPVQQKDTTEIERTLAEQEQAIQAAALEAQRQKEEITKQAALLRAAQTGYISQSQWQQAELSRQRAEQAREAESLRQTQEAAQKLALQLKSTAASQKAEAEKSIFSRAKETISGFIFGPTQPSQSPQEAAKENRNLLEAMVKSQSNPAIANAIKEAFTTFQETLFAFKQPLYWDSQKSSPNELWLDIIKTNLTTLIKYKILSVKEAIDVVVKALDSYPQVDNMMKGSIKSILRKALKNEELQVQQREQAEKMKGLHKKIAEEKQIEEKRARVNQEMLQRETARKSLLAKEEEEKQKTLAAQQFAQQMSEWSNFLNQIENASNPTNEYNRIMTTQAIIKAENLIRLIPKFRSKEDVHRAEEKLKQDFINSLLRQQAARQHSLNIYENQRQFDTAINNIF